MKTIGIISQARMTSSRLPGKVLLPAAGEPMLLHHVNRLRDVGAPLYLAITERSEDDLLEAFAREQGIPFFRGDEDDVLSRFYHLAVRESLDVIVRVTSDCPLIDGGLVREGIDRFLAEADERVYLSNSQRRTYPAGMDFEIVSRELLEEAQREAVHDHEREHVMPYFYQGRCDCRTVHVSQDVDHSGLRVTLDTPADYELIRTLIEVHDALSLDHVEMTQLFAAHPELAAINAAIQQKTVPNLNEQD